MHRQLVVVETHLQFNIMTQIGNITLDTSQVIVKTKLDELLTNLNSQKPRIISKFYKKSTPKGLYIYGQVGRGKTMLMDSFYQEVKSPLKSRVHFHEFMQAIHEMLREQAIDIVAKTLSTEAKVFCFDEFHVTNIADAMILARLFREMFNQGITLVATSNQAPSELYKNGLHRERFMPFIDLLSENVEICEMTDSIDYRRIMLKTHKRYFINDCDSEEINEIFNMLAMNSKPMKAMIVVKGHEVSIPCQANGVAWFKFSEICEQNYGPADYIKIAESYHSIIISEIPQLCEQMHNEAKRFITLIDILHDQGKNLIIQAAKKPDELYIQGHNAELFKRTASRLIEMTGG